jgi:hypothetical protein
MTNTQQSIDINLLGGGSWHADRFNAYRLGGDLPLASEFPLTIPGYFYQQISARDFVSFTTQYTIPLDPSHSWSLSPIGAIAAVEYIPGMAQRGAVNSGVGLGLGYRSHSGVWQVMATYGYGFEARQIDGSGGQTIGILCQINLGVRNPGGPTHLDRFIGFLPNHL